MVMQKVTVYSSSTCGYCRMAKDYLRENGVQFVERDVNSDPEAQRDMARMKATGVPVIVVDDQVIMGFDKARLDSLLGKKIVECPKCRAKMRIPKNKGILQVSCPKCATQFKVDSSK
jgi:glutaredoxin 3